jgi:hypothetical protein
MIIELSLYETNFDGTQPAGFSVAELRTEKRQSSARLAMKN